MEKNLEKNKLDEIKVLLKTGQINYDQAKVMAKPYLKAMNEKMAKIAKEYGYTPRAVSFIGFMR